MRVKVACHVRMQISVLIVMHYNQMHYFENATPSLYTCLCMVGPAAKPPAHVRLLCMYVGRLTAALPTMPFCHTVADADGY